MAEYRDLVRLHQLVGGGEHAFVLAADQEQAAGVGPFDQMANEFDAVHSRHVEVEQDQFRRPDGIGQRVQRNDAAGIGGDGRIAEILQQAADELEHERLVVEQHDSERGFVETVRHGSSSS